MQGQHVGLFKQLRAALGHGVAICVRAGLRVLAAPDQHMHAKGAPVRCHEFADAAIAPDAQGLAVQHHAQSEVHRHGGGLEAGLLPGAVLEAGHVLRDAAHRGHDQRPGQFGRGHGRTGAFAHGDAPFGAGLYVDVGADATGLRDQFQAREFLHQLPWDWRAFPDEHQHVRIAQPHRQLPHAFDGVGEDLGRVGFQFLGAAQLADGVLIVIKDHDVHGHYCARKTLRHCPAARRPLRTLVWGAVAARSRVATQPLGSVVDRAQTGFLCREALQFSAHVGDAAREDHTRVAPRTVALAVGGADNPNRCRAVGTRLRSWWGRTTGGGGFWCISYGCGSTQPAGAGETLSNRCELVSSGCGRRLGQPAVDELQRCAPGVALDADSHVKLQKGVGHRQD
mgnify:CR=1 FL=1